MYQTFKVIEEDFSKLLKEKGEVEKAKEHAIQNENYELASILQDKENELKQKEKKLVDDYVEIARPLFFKNFFCQDCKNIFDIPLDNGSKLMNETRCSHCGSKRFYKSSVTNQAIIEGKSIDEIIAIIESEKSSDTRL